MVKHQHKIIYYFLILIIVPFSVFAVELMDENSMDEVSASAGVTIALPEFRYSMGTHHNAIGGEDGLGIPEAPEGAWFVFDSDRMMTLDLSGSVFDIDIVTIGKNDIGLNSKLRDALFPVSMTDESRTVVKIDFGDTNFYSFTEDSRMTLQFANNKEGDEDGSQLFSKEIAQFQMDGASMTINSDDAKVYIFAHPDGNFEITPP